MNIACNNTIDSSSDCSKFIFFGCWNNINCDNEYIYRNIVLDYLHKNEQDIKQIYLAGDNWYTNKKKIGHNEFKLYLTDVLRTGYEKIYAMNKDIYIAIGNHDVDSDIKSKTTSTGISSPTNTNNNLKKDCNINTQKYYLQHIKKATEENSYSEIAIPTLEGLNDMRDELTDEVLCVKGINIYVDNIGVRYNKDNIIIIINTNHFYNFKKGRAYLKEINDKISEVRREQQRKNQGSKKSIGQIFVMGHIPLFTYRKDKKDKKDKIAIHEINKVNLEYRELIAILYDILTDNNIIYLCADTHNFSIMRIVHNGKVLIQITAGTGGADPDMIKGNYVITPASSTVEISVSGIDCRSLDAQRVPKVPLEPENKIYKITAYALNSYGYVRMNIFKTYIDIFYKQIITDNAEIATSAYGTKARPYSDPINEKDKMFNKSLIPILRRQESLSTSRPSSAINTKSNKVSIINYKIMRNTMEVRFVNKIIEKKSFANNSIYKSKNICNIMEANPKGYITDIANNLTCFKKSNEKHIASSQSPQLPK